MTDAGTERIYADFERAFTSIQRLMETQGRALAAIFDQVEEQGDGLVALSNRIQAATEAFALRSELDDLRLEVREATPFDPPEAA